MMDPAYLEQIGVFMDPVDRQLKRHRIRNANFEYAAEKQPGELHGPLLAYDQQLVPHPVILPLATDAASVKEARQKAVAAGADFLDPVHGWLRWGRKREVERPENLGASTIRYESRRVTVAPAPDATASDDDGAAEGGAQKPEKGSKS